MCISDISDIHIISRGRRRRVRRDKKARAERSY